MYPLKDISGDIEVFFGLPDDDWETAFIKSLAEVCVYCGDSARVCDVGDDEVDKADELLRGRFGFCETKLCAVFEVVVLNVLSNITELDFFLNFDYNGTKTYWSVGGLIAARLVWFF